MFVVALPAAQAVKINGQVRDSDGRPLAGYVELIAGPGRVQAQTQPTDSLGRFSLEAPTAARLVVVARADGHVSAEREIVLSSPDTVLTVDFTLPRAGSVTGRVVDSQGFPVPGAKVRVEYPGEGRRVVYETEMTAQTDSEGFFNLRYVARGRPFLLAASAEDRPPSFAGPFTLDAASLESVVLRAAAPGAVVRVRVLAPGGEPAAGAAVRLRAEADAAPYSPDQRRSRAFFEATQRLAFADSSGTAEFRGVPPGKATVVVSRPGVRPARLEVSVAQRQVAEATVVLP
ncbi:MAG TPA: carboxypeptidase-like regulatory domain-containing protein [Bryobacteraceae bacterium]|nr:carboxypeptidase-like regulatory domain-containing protein [Bryobacteraceae bacterium]